MKVMEVGENVFINHCFTRMASGAAVTKDVAPRTVVGGNLAKFIKNVNKEE